MKKLLVFILTLTMILSCLPFVIAAETIAAEPADEFETQQSAQVAAVGATDSDQGETTQPDTTEVVTEPATQPVTEPPTEAPEPPVIPEITKVTPCKEGVKLTFTSYQGAAKYRVFLKRSDSWKKIADTSALSLTLSSLTDNATYVFTVRAMDKNGKYISSYNKEGFKYTYCAPPVLTSASPAIGGLCFKWKASTGAKSYRVYAKINGNWAVIADTTDISYLDTDVLENTSRTYTVRACDAKGRLISYFDRTGVTGTYVAAPQLKTLVATAIGQKLTWSSSKGTAKYRVFYKKDNAGSWKKLTDTTATVIEIKGLQYESMYTFTVRSMNKDSKYISAYYTDGISGYYLTPPELPKITKVSSGNKLSYKANSKAAGVRIYRKTYGGSYARIKDTTSTTYTDTNAKSNTLYAYTVRYIDAAGNTISGFIDESPFYYNGTIANGKITVDGKTLTFKDGKVFQQGYVTKNGKTYYYSSNGNLLKNRIVGNKTAGYTYSDANGVCSQSQEIKLACAFVKANGTGDTKEEQLASCYKAIARMPYRRDTNHPKSAADMTYQAVEMFTKKSGNCFMYAASFAEVAKVLGYRVRVVTGTVGLLAGGTGPHGWTEVYVNGKWLSCDPDGAMQNGGTLSYYMMTAHAWNPVASKRYELTLDSNCSAVWK